MKEWLHKIEVIVDKSIPYLVILLLFIIIGEIFYHEYLHHYEHYIEALDAFIIGMFIVDLGFKWVRVRKIPLFVRKYWLDILAVFPFILLFRLFEEISALFHLGRIGEQVKEGQLIFHEGLEIEKEGSKIIREIEKTGKLSRARFMTRLVRPLQRLPRLLKIIPYFEKPSGKHHPHEKV